MQEYKNTKINPTKKYFGFLLFIWLSGALITGLTRNYNDKIECIESEGIIKGWLWCSKENRNSFTYNMLSGLIWPIKLIKTSNSSELSENYSPKMTQKEFDRSSIGTVYTCFSIAAHNNNREDGKAMMIFLNEIKQKSESTHNDYMYYSALHMLELQDKNKEKIYYDNFCKEPINNLKKAIANIKK